MADKSKKVRDGNGCAAPSCQQTGGQSLTPAAYKSAAPDVFFPPPLSDAWTKWIAGHWLGSAKSDSGKGRAIVDIEQALRGQFLIIHLQAKIAELEAEHLKKHMKATEAAELRQQTKAAIVDKRAEPPRE